MNDGRPVRHGRGHPRWPRTDPQVYADAADAALAELGAEPTAAQRRDFSNHDHERIRTHCEALDIDPARFWELKESYASGNPDRLRSGERAAPTTISTRSASWASRLRSVSSPTTGRKQPSSSPPTGSDSTSTSSAGEIRRSRDTSGASPIPTTSRTRSIDSRSRDGLYVGDSPKDITAGRAAGLETAFLRRPHNRERERPPNATDEIESLTELLSLVDQPARRRVTTRYRRKIRYPWYSRY